MDERYYVDEFINGGLAGSNYGNFNSVKNACFSIRNNRIDPRLRRFVVVDRRTGKIAKGFLEKMMELYDENEAWHEAQREAEEKRRFDRQNGR